MTPLAQQISAVDLAQRVMSGSAPKPSRKEAEYISQRLQSAYATLRWLQDNEAAIKAAARKDAA